MGGGRRKSAQRNRPDAPIIKLEAGMQVVAHENRTATRERQLVARCSGDGVTLDYDGIAHYTISKLGDRCIDPHLPRGRKRFAFTLLWFEKFSSVDPGARISRIRKYLVLAILVGRQARDCVVAAAFEESSEKEPMLQRLCIVGNIRSSFVDVGEG